MKKASFFLNFLWIAQKKSVHLPSEVLGYDDNKLLLCVVAACHGDPAYYTWYHDGEIIKRGPGLCCLPDGATGDCKVKVQNNAAIRQSSCCQTNMSSSDLFASCETCSSVP